MGHPLGLRRHPGLKPIRVAMQRIAVTVRWILEAAPCRLTRLRLSTYRWQVPARARHITARLFEPRDEVCLPDSEGQYDRAQLLDWVRVGHQVLVAELDGRIIAYLTIALGRQDSRADRSIYGLRRREAFIVHAYTLPQYRGFGCGLQLVHYAVGWLRGQGYAWLYATAGFSNRSSFRSLQRGGFKELGTSRVWLSARWHRGYLVSWRKALLWHH